MKSTMQIQVYADENAMRCMERSCEDAITIYWNLLSQLATKDAEITALRELIDNEGSNR